MNKKILIASLFATLMLVVPMTSVVGVISKNVTMDNQPPEPPEISGPSNGIVGQEYAFYFSTVDPEGHNVSFYVEWGDGTSDGWSEYVESGSDIGFSHVWFKQDDYFIRCKAKDILGKESDWSYLTIIMSRNKAFNFNFNLLESLFEHFPILKHLLRL